MLHAWYTTDISDSGPSRDNGTPQKTRTNVGPLSHPVIKIVTLYLYWQVECVISGCQEFPCKTSTDNCLRRTGCAPPTLPGRQMDSDGSINSQMDPDGFTDSQMDSLSPGNLDHTNNLNHYIFNFRFKRSTQWSTRSSVVLMQVGKIGSSNQNWA